MLKMVRMNVYRYSLYIIHIQHPTVEVKHNKLFCTTFLTCLHIISIKVVDMMCEIYSTCAAPDLSVTIGLQKRYYSVREDSGSLQVCMEILSGDIGEITISINYSTIDGTAEGMEGAKQ